MTHPFRWLVAMLISVLWATLAFGLEADGEDEKSSEDAEEDKTIAELIDGDTEVAGLFTFYRDSDTGKTTLLLKKNQLQKEYI